MVFVFPEERPSLIGQALGQGLSGGFRERLGSDRLKGIIGGDQTLDEQMASILGSSTILPEQKQQALQSLQQRQQTRQQEQKQLLDLIKERRRQDVLSRFGLIPDSVQDGQKSVSDGDLSDQQILALATQDPQLARVAQQQRKQRQQSFSDEAKRHAPVVNEFFKEADKRGQELIRKRGLLDLQEDAIRNNNLGFFSLNNLAELTGIEGLRDPGGALFNFAAKEFLLSNISRAGPRPNQWIEQQISKSLAKQGRSREANLSVVASQKADLDVAEEEEKIISDIEREHEQKFGFVKRSIGREVRQKLKKFATRRQNILEHELREINNEFSTGKVPKGTPLGPNKVNWYLDKAKGNVKKARQMAIKDGHSIS